MLSVINYDFCITYKVNYVFHDALLSVNEKYKFKIEN